RGAAAHGHAGAARRAGRPAHAPGTGRLGMSGARPRILILGGGFAGVGAAQKLKHVDADVVLVDRHDYHTFQPLLYQLATGLLEIAAVAHPLRDLFHDQPNMRVHQATVTGVDLDARHVQLDGMEPIAYDALVLALGAE